MNVQIRKMDGSSLARKIRLALVEDDRIMKACLRQSPITWEASIDGEGACIWGVVPPTLLSDRAYIWLYTTDVAEAHQFILVRKSRIMLEEMLEEYPILFGHCDVGCPRSIRWLKWLGAEFGHPDGMKIPFQIRKK